MRGDYTSLYSLSRRRSEYRLLITEPEAINCFSINFLVFTNNNQHNFYKITQKGESYSHSPVTITSETAYLDKSECKKISSHLEVYTMN